MLKAVSEHGKFAVTNGKQPVFTINNALLYCRDGEECPIPLDGFGRGEKKNARFETNCIIAEDTAVFKIDAEIKGTMPAFKQQQFLCHSQSVSLSLILSGKSDCTVIYQHKDWWLRPCFTAKFEKIPSRTQLMIWKDGSEYRVLMAFCGENYRTDFSGNSDGITVTLSSNCDGIARCNQVAFALSCGKNPYLCLTNAAKQLIALSDSPVRLREEKTFPAIFDYFGWCSWDAFYKQVNEDGILQKLEEFKEKSLLPNWVLIDDGWSQADYTAQKLQGFEADLNKFPNGLKATVNKIKGYGVSNVGVWQAIMGYWNGIEQNSQVASAVSEYTTQLPDGRIVPSTNSTKSFGFWNNWHSYLRKCDVDFVKVDSQSAISIFFEGFKSYGGASRGVQCGLGASVAVNFDGNIINCMGMAPEEMWNRPIASISRNSDDFMPNESFGFREHALQNCYNSLLHGQFYWGDWDMFWSDGTQSCQNSILRAVSGGVVYTSDKVGETNPKTLLPLMLKSGQLLRCEDVGMPTLDSLLCDPVQTDAPLKIFNRYKDCYMIAAFNISKQTSPISGVIHLDEIPKIEEDCCWLYDCKNVSGQLLKRDEQAEFAIESGHAQMFLILPMSEFAPVGLLEKYLSPATIVYKREFENRIDISLKENGTFAALTRKIPTMVLLDGKEIDWSIKDCLFSAECTSSAPLLTIYF